MTPAQRTTAFCARFGLRAPILLAPMAGASHPALSVAVCSAGGMGACGALLMSPDEILAWADIVRPSGPFQLNLWAPDPSPLRVPDQELAVREFLKAWGPEPPSDAGDAVPLDFEAQCDAVVRASPAVASSIMGLFPPHVVERLKRSGIAWFATVSTVAEARAAEAAGADVIVAQGMEAGGHRGAFDADFAERHLVGLVSLVPAVVDAVRLPVVATGGLADARGVAAALALGASAIQIGTGFLRSAEADIPFAWADALGRAQPEDTVLTRAFSGRSGRSLATSYVRAAASPEAPPPAPYPVQRGLTSAMRVEGLRRGDINRMQAWAGQSAALAQSVPASSIVETLWQGASQWLHPQSSSSNPV